MAHEHRHRAHAIVIGASTAGLMAARILSERFRRVTVVERDELPDTPEPRKGVPQARHVHVMLKSGMDFLEGLFPGLTREMLAAGSTPADFGREVSWSIEGFWRARPRTDLTLYVQTRPFLDWHVQRRVRALANVDIRGRCDVLGLLHDARGKRVHGVRVKPHDSDADESIEADLVVDTSGRGSRSPRALEEMGYGRPEREEVAIDLCYTTCLMQPPAGARPDWKIVAVFGSRAKRYQGGLILTVEKDLWQVSLIGYHGVHAPAEHEGFLAFARALEVPDVYEAIKDAVPLTAPTPHRVPSSRRHRYERMNRFPDGLVILGDALCSFNPAYGQGITAAARAVAALAELLDACKAPSLAGFSKAFQKRAAEAIDFPWLMALTEDLSHPESIGRRPRWLLPVSWYKRELVRACAADDDLAVRLMKVVCAQGDFQPLLDPRAVTRVLASAARFRVGALSIAGRR